MAKDLLLEIGLEEMPAHVVTPSRKQLEKKVIDFLEDQALDYETIESFSTPRRLSVKVSQLIEEQADVEEEVKGPAKKIALDADGNWTKAAEGFVRGQGLSTNDIYFKEIKGVDYVHLTKYVKGEATKEVVKGMKKIIEGMTFPVSMHWSSYHFKYIRPIHWLVFLFGEEVIPISILDVKAGNQARGHRFLGDPVTLISAKDYQTEMAKQFVIVQPEERKNKIVAQAKQLAETNDWQLDLDEDLLEEVTNLVEYPTAFAGNFDEKYLSLPEEVLITSMKEHQRYFEVRSQNGELLPFFISVRNGDAVHLDNVIKGNEKVLTARLEDAEFFYKEDQKLSIEDCVNKLKQVTFHEKIGTVYEKMQRVAGICQLIGQELNFTEEELNDLKRASEIYKFDLVTNMVGEFPELQGIMGEKYALIQGENPFVSQAVREHYLPNSSDGKLPQSKVGSVLAIADKLDSLVTFFAAEMIPSGSNDPYALRRQAYGIIRIIENNQWNFPIRQLYKKIMETIDFSSVKSVNNLKEKREEILSFIKARVKQRLLSENFRHDLVEAVTESSQENIAAIFEISKVLATHQADDNFKETIEALTRTIQLAKKNPEVLAEEESNVVNPDLFENQAEKELYDQVEAISQAFDSNSSEENYLALCSLRPAIADYFDQTMVMSDNIEIRNNRLKQLGKIAKLAQSFAQLEHLIIK